MCLKNELKKSVLQCVQELGVGASAKVARSLGYCRLSDLKKVSLTLLRCWRQGLVNRTSRRRGRVREYVYKVTERGRQRLGYWELNRRTESGPTAPVNVAGKAPVLDEQPKAASTKDRILFLELPTESQDNVSSFSTELSLLATNRGLARIDYLSNSRIHSLQVLLVAMDSRAHDDAMLQYVLFNDRLQESEKRAEFFRDMYEWERKQRVKFEKEMMLEHCGRLDPKIGAALKAFTQEFMKVFHQYRSMWRTAYDANRRFTEYLLERAESRESVVLWLVNLVVAGSRENVRIRIQNGACMVFRQKCRLPNRVDLHVDPQKQTYELATLRQALAHECPISPPKSTEKREEERTDAPGQNSSWEDVNFRWHDLLAYS